MNISDIATASQLTDAEYLPVWTALMETARGRRFLSEFARRTRATETRTLLDAVHKLEGALMGAQHRGAAKAPPAPQTHPHAANQQTQRDDAAHHLRVAITQAVPELETLSRINGRAMADLQEAADEIHAGVAALCEAARAVAHHDNGAAARACETIAMRVTDIDEIIAVQNMADARAQHVGAHLAELVTAPPHAEERQEAGHARRAAPRQPLAQHEYPAEDRSATGEARPVEHRDRLPPVTDVAAASPRHAAGQQGQPANEDARQSPAVQQLIQEITARLLNGQDKSHLTQRDFGQAGPQSI